MKTAAPVTIPFKQEGRTVMLLGGLGSCDMTRFGGTQYAKIVLEKMWGLPPALDMEYEKRVQAAAREIAKPESKQDHKRLEKMTEACFDSEDFKEGRRAFMEKRKPAFKGR